MPRSRGSEMHQRPSPRGSAQLRTSSSDSEARRHRVFNDRSSPRLQDRPSPRSVQSDSVNHKKLGTRITELESQLGQAQEELKMLKDQLVSAKAEKKEAQEQIENKTKKQAPPEPAAATLEKPSIPYESLEQATDVFEVPLEKVAADEHPVGTNKLIESCKMEPTRVSLESPASKEPEKPSADELVLKDDEISLLKSKLEGKEREVKAMFEENNTLKGQVSEASQKISEAQVKEQEVVTRLAQVEKELEESKDKTSQLNGKLKAAEAENEAYMGEIKKLKVQTEQWKKAADAAAAVLAGDVDVNGRRVSERSGSVGKPIGGTFEHPKGLIGSPGFDDYADDVFRTGKRKNSGIKMLGDFWRKKGQK